MSLRPDRRLLALSASAGSGKTFALSVRYLSLLFGGAKPSEILAVTFTNKAANEMEERIVSALKELKPEMLEEIASQTNKSKEDIQKEAPKIYKKFLSSDISIMTIDGFIKSILDRFCWYASIPPHYTVESIEKSLFFERFITTLDNNDYIKLIDLAKNEAGKSSSVESFFDLLYLKDKELPPLTQEDIQKYDTDAILTTAHKISEYFLKSQLSNRGKKTMIFDTLEELLSKSWVWKESLQYWDYKKYFTPHIDEYLHTLQEQIADYFNAKERYFLNRINRLYGEYKNSRIDELIASSTLHFTDIEHFVFDLVQRSDFMHFIQFRLDAKYKHILFDEFQDTSVTQYRIFEPFIEEIASSNEDRSFFYVGDTKQSIYRFRGGQKELFDYVKRRFKVTQEYLPYNYRSKKEIVEFVNNTFNYIKPKQIAKKDGGFVEVIELDSDDILKETTDIIVSLNEKGISDSEIAILVHDNKEILKVAEYLKENLGKDADTHKRSLVRSQKSAKIIISAIRMIYAKRENRDTSIYKLEILSLLGMKYNPSFEIDIADDKRVSHIVKELMQKYNLFDEAAMKLLEFTIPMDCIDDFIYKIDRYDEELPSKSSGGVQILTIHKSKGLEFEHLIVLDRLGRPRSDSSPVIFDYDDIKLRTLKMRFKNRELIDKDYASILQKEKNLAKEDHINRNYVAFTRAKESLHIIKKDKSSSFEMLDLKPVKTGTIESKTPAPIPKAPKAIDITITDYGRQKSKEEKEKEYKADDLPAIYLGNAVHYIFETGCFEASRNRYGLYCDIDTAIKTAKEGMKNSQYLSLCKGDMMREIPFLKSGKVNVIDLLVKRESEYIIIDYKTTTPHDMRGYIKQVRHYMDAISSFYPEYKVNGYLYFLDTMKIVEV